MKISVYDCECIFSDIPGEWDELLANSLANRIFLTCEWQSVWWQAYHPGRIWALIVRDDGGRIMGIAPWFIEVKPDGTRVVRTIGCVDVTDYVEVIARQGYEREVFEALADYAVQHAELYDLFKLCNIPEESPTHTLAPDIFGRYGMEVEVRLQEVCPVVKLPPTWEEYVAGLDKKNRHELRRKLRRAATAPVDWYIVGPEYDLHTEMQRFLRLMASSHPEKARFLELPGNREFIERMVPVVAAQGWLQLAFLTVGGEAAAAYLNFDYGNHIMVYNSGHDAAVHGGELSPGIVLLARLIEHAIEQGREKFDFLRGDESYKYDMGGQNTNVYQLLLKPPAAS